MKTMHVRSHVGGGGPAVESHHTPHSEEERDLVDVMTAVTGLLELFKVGWSVVTYHEMAVMLC